MQGTLTAPQIVTRETFSSGAFFKSLPALAPVLSDSRGQHPGEPGSLEDLRRIHPVSERAVAVLQAPAVAFNA